MGNVILFIVFIIAEISGLFSNCQGLEMCISFWGLIFTIPILPLLLLIPPSYLQTTSSGINIIVITVVLWIAISFTVGALIMHQKLKNSAELRQR